MLMLKNFQNFKLFQTFGFGVYLCQKWIVTLFYENGRISLNNGPIWKIEKVAYSGDGPDSIFVRQHRFLSASRFFDILLKVIGYISGYITVRYFDLNSFINQFLFGISNSVIPIYFHV